MTKAQPDFRYAKIHITRNEWETAQSSLNYIFHVWHLSGENQLFVLSVSDIEKHIPTNNLAGEWETVEIPCRALIGTGQIIKS